MCITAVDIPDNAKSAVTRGVSESILSRSPTVFAPDNSAGPSSDLDRACVMLVIDARMRVDS